MVKKVAPLLFGITTATLITRLKSFSIVSLLESTVPKRNHESCHYLLFPSPSTSTNTHTRKKSTRSDGGDDHDFEIRIIENNGEINRDDVRYHHHHHGDGRDRRRRAVISTLLSFATLHGISTPPMGQANSNVDFVMDMEYPTLLALDDVTRQVRTSVVRGAQLIDKVDGQWERFSDDLGLGRKRNLPKRNVIDVGGNAQSKDVIRSEIVDERYNKVDWNDQLASNILTLCDETFLSCLRTQQPLIIITMDELHRQIEYTKQLTRKSFFPPPLSSSTTITSSSSRQLEFNFDCYAHFKVYNDILIKSNVVFPPFQREFITNIGKSLVHLAQEQLANPPLLTIPNPSTKNIITECVQYALSTTDSIASFLQRQGLISSWERSIPSIDDIEDFSILSSDLSYSLALNGDVTLNSQLLLQELGYRLYPAFGKWMVHEGVMRCFTPADEDENHSPGEKGKIARISESAVQVQVDDYYMDTNYNSNPDLFEVKQILLSIVIQRD